MAIQSSVWPARFLLVGEAPSRKHGKRNLQVCLVCRTLNRQPVAGTMGWLRINHRQLFNFAMAAKHVNLLDEWPGPSGKGSAFPIDNARFSAAEMRVGFYSYDAIFLAGKRVAKVFNVKEDYFERVPGDIEMYVVPHPSGINTWWNDPCNRETARQFLLKF